jgi:D-arabinose 1-dehydrogenase-like Zn-dependent alcohol dehydrogenase
MLDFAATNGVRPVLETMPMSQANEALARVREGKANLRIVLNADA